MAFHHLLLVTLINKYSRSKIRDRKNCVLSNVDWVVFRHVNRYDPRYPQRLVVVLHFESLTQKDLRQFVCIEIT